MNDVIQPGVLETPKKRRKIRISDIIIFAVIVVIIVVLAVTLTNKLRLKHDVSSAQTISGHVIADIQKRDGTAVYKLGSKQFQKSTSTNNLTQEFQSRQIATLKSPALDRTIVYTGKDGSKTIFFIYKYTALKVPYYIRTAMKQESGQWKLVLLSGNIDESQLIVQ